jgi:hypothetical protein
MIFFRGEALFWTPGVGLQMKKMGKKIGTSKAGGEKKNSLLGQNIHPCIPSFLVSSLTKCTA